MVRIRIRRFGFSLLMGTLGGLVVAQKAPLFSPKRLSTPSMASLSARRHFSRLRGGDLDDPTPEDPQEDHSLHPSSPLEQLRPTPKNIVGAPQPNTQTEDSRLWRPDHTFGTLQKASSSFLQRTAQQATRTWHRYAGSGSASDVDVPPLIDQNENTPGTHPHSQTRAQQSSTSLLSWMSELKSQPLLQMPAWIWQSLLVHSAQQGGGPTLLGMYVWALVGASFGFYLFLYFISLGYAAGIGLPLTMALTHFLGTPVADARSHKRTVLHTCLVLLWSVRMWVFLVWREYVNWPALHKRIVQVNQRPPKKQSEEKNADQSGDSEQSVEETSAEQPTPQQQPSQQQPSQQQPSQQGPPSLLVKTLCWFAYSFFYLCMLSPSFFRMRHHLLASSTPAKSLTPYRPAVELTENLALAMQSMGLFLESVADWQKSTFKAQLNCRYEWCGTAPGWSLWRWSTHPNYLGEGLFWGGTFLGGFVSLMQHFSFRNDPVADFLKQTCFMVAGLCFILKVLQGAVESLDEKQEQKYGQLLSYAEFRQSHGFWGPKWRISKSSTDEIAESARASEAEAASLNATMANEGEEDDSEM